LIMGARNSLSFHRRSRIGLTGGASLAIGPSRFLACLPAEPSNGCQAKYIT